MQGPKQSTFRPTVMAAPPAAQPALLRYPEVKPLGEGYVDVGVPTEGGPIPDDFVLRELLEIDVSSDLAVIGLVARYGALTSLGEDPFLYLPRSERWRGPFPGILEARQAFAETGEFLHPDFVASVPAMRLHLLAARAMGRHLLAHLEGDASGVLKAWPLDGGFNKPLSTGLAWYWWQDHMNSALAPFGMFIQVEHPDGYTRTGAVALPAPTLYNACALQLAQILAGESQVKRCANERCARPFTRQRTTAARRRNPDQFHLSGVLYCSRECLKAKNERERRQRRKANGS